MFEPINVLMRDPDRLAGYDITPVKPLAAKLTAFFESIQPSGADPMVDFDERDLVRHAERAGFADIGLELRVTVKNGKRPVPWEHALRMSGNPLVPPLGDVLERRGLHALVMVALEHCGSTPASPSFTKPTRAATSPRGGAGPIRHRTPGGVPIDSLA